MTDYRMKQYNSYHTTLKQLARRNKLAINYLNDIDRSTVWRWKQESSDKYIGSELSNIEVSVMKSLLLEERFMFWPVCSIAYYALRERLLYVSGKVWVETIQEAYNRFIKVSQDVTQIIHQF